MDMVAAATVGIGLGVGLTVGTVSNDSSCIPNLNTPGFTTPLSGVGGGSVSGVGVDGGC